MPHEYAFPGSGQYGGPALNFTSDSTVDLIYWHPNFRWDIIRAYTYGRSGSSYTMVSDSDTLYGRVDGGDFYALMMGVCITTGDSTEMLGEIRVTSLRSTEVDPEESGIFSTDSVGEPIVQVKYQIVDVKYARE